MSISVSKDGTANYLTISDAIKAASENEIIKVLPGTYTESLRLRKPISIVGEGPRNKIIIQSNNSECIDIVDDEKNESSDSRQFEIKKVTLINSPHKSKDNRSFTVSIKNANVLIIDCDIQGSSLASIGAYGSAANVFISKSHIHDTSDRSNISNYGTPGIFFYDKSKGKIVDCVIDNNHNDGISVKNSKLIINNSIIKNNWHYGIIGSNHADITVVDCKILKNSWGAIRLEENSKANISKSDLTYNDPFSIDETSILKEKSNKLKLTVKEILIRIKNPDSNIYDDIEPYLEHNSEKVKLQAKLTIVSRYDCYHRLLSDLVNDKNPKVRLGVAKNAMSDLKILSQLKKDKDSSVKKYVSSILPKRKQAEQLGEGIVKWFNNVNKKQLKKLNESDVFEEYCLGFITVYELNKNNSRGKYIKDFFSEDYKHESESFFLEFQKYLYTNSDSRKKYYIETQFRYCYKTDEGFQDLEIGEFIIDFKNSKLKELGSWNIIDKNCKPSLLNDIFQNCIDLKDYKKDGNEIPLAYQDKITGVGVITKIIQNPSISGKGITHFWNRNYNYSNEWKSFTKKEKENRDEIIQALTNNPALKSFIDELVFIDDVAIRDIFTDKNFALNQYTDSWNEWSEDRYNLLKNTETPEELIPKLLRDKGLINKLLENFYQLDQSIQDRIISSIENLNFENEGHWRIFKSFYKASEKIIIKEVLSTLLIKLDKLERSWGNWKDGFFTTTYDYKTRSYLKSSVPGWRTVLYLKRRGKRFVKNLSNNDPKLALDLSLMLITKNSNMKSWQWVLYDIIYGRSKRFIHTRHGRGEIRQIKRNSFPYRFEERITDKVLWNEKAEELKSFIEQRMLSSTESDENNIPWQVEEFIIKILHRTHIKLPFHSSKLTIDISKAKIKFWYESQSIWLKYLANKITENLFKIPFKIDKKPIGASYLIESNLSYLFANMLFYNSNDKRKEIYDLAIKSYPPPEDINKSILNTSPMVSILSNSYKSVGLLGLINVDTMQRETSLPKKVCELIIKEQNSKSMSDLIWITFKKTVDNSNNWTSGKSLKFWRLNKDGLIENLDNDLIKKNNSSKKINNYINILKDKNCSSKDILKIINDFEIPWDRSDSEDLLALICKNKNTPSETLETIIKLYANSSKVSIGLSLNPNQELASKVLEEIKIGSILIESGSIKQTQKLMIVDFYYKFLIESISLINKTLPEFKYISDSNNIIKKKKSSEMISSRILNTLKIINSKLFLNYFKTDYSDKRFTLMLDMAETLFYFNNQSLNKLCYTTLNNYPDMNYPHDFLSTVLNWLNSAKNGTDEQKQVVLKNMRRIISNISISTGYRKSEKLFSFIDHDHFYVTDFLWNSINDKLLLTDSQKTLTSLILELVLYVIKKPEKSYYSKWSKKSMEEIAQISKLSNFLNSKSALEILKKILILELEALMNPELLEKLKSQLKTLKDKENTSLSDEQKIKDLEKKIEKFKLNIFPVLDGKLMVHIINKNIPKISELFFNMIKFKILHDKHSDGVDISFWIPLIDKLNDRTSKTLLFSIMVDQMEESGSYSLDWLNFINLFDNNQRRRIKTVIIKNLTKNLDLELNKKKRISLDWIIYEKYLLLFNKSQRKKIENCIVDSYQNHSFKTSWYSEDPLRFYLLYPHGFNGGEVANGNKKITLKKFGHKLFDISWKIADVAKLEKGYIDKFIKTLIETPHYRANRIVSKIRSLNNISFRDSILKSLEKELLASKIMFTACSLTISRLVINNMSIKNVLDLFHIQDPIIWKKLKPLVLKKIIKKQVGLSFWKPVFDYLENNEASMVLLKVKSPSGKLIIEGGEAWKKYVSNEKIIPRSFYTRTLKDPDFIDNFYTQNDPDTLSIDNNLFSEEVFTWVKHNQKLFKANSKNLFTVSTHKLPIIRNWGLKKSNLLGMRLQYALKLIESLLPESFQLAKDWFISSKGKNEFRNIMALCDSPVFEVRQFGIGLLRKRSKNFFNLKKLQMITENSDPEVLKFAADKVLSGNEYQNFMRLFDQAILRHKEKYRQAKEAVKRRIEKDLSVDPKILIELARGHNKKDSEWALVQLTRLSLEGKKIDEIMLQTVN